MPAGIGWYVFNPYFNDFLRNYFSYFGAMIKETNKKGHWLRKNKLARKLSNLPLKAIV